MSDIKINPCYDYTEDGKLIINGVVQEDVPTNSMAGGAIANKPMGLGGMGGRSTFLLKRQLVGAILHKVKSRKRAK